MIAGGRCDSAACALVAADRKKIDERKDRAHEDKVVALCTNRPGVDAGRCGPRRGGEKGTASSSRRARARGPLCRARAPELCRYPVVYSARVVVNALWYRENAMRIENSPPRIELDPVLAMLSGTMACPAQGPGPPGLPSPPPPSPPPRIASPGIRQPPPSPPPLAARAPRQAGALPARMRAAVR